MNSLDGQWVILLELTPGAIHVVKDIKNLGLRILYIGRESVISEMADQVLDYDLLNDLDLFLEREMPTLAAVNAVGVICFIESYKHIEREISKRLQLLNNDEAVYVLLRDKFLFRQKLTELSLPSVNFAFIADTDEARAPLEFPFIIKPNYGYASGGVQLVRNNQEFLSALKTIRRMNRFVFRKQTNLTVGALCEEFIDGPEYSVDSLTTEGETRSLVACGRGFPAENNFCDYAYFTPCPNESELLAEAQTTLRSLYQKIGVRFGPSHAEFRFCPKRKSLILLEIGFRVGFAGNIGRLFELTSGIPYNTLAIRASLRDLSLSELHNLQRPLQRYGLSLNPDAGTGGKIKAIHGLDFLEADESIKSFYFNFSVGDVIVPYPRGIGYLGEIVLVTGEKESFDLKFQTLLQKFRFEFEPV